MNDNRNYNYSENSISKRNEFETIIKWVQKGSSVIDLGSGDGTLLRILKDRKDTHGLGVEISPSGVNTAKKKGIKSIVGRIDEKLPFKNKAFDYAICNVTVQMVMYPEILLTEMSRISKKQIVTFPNFGFLLNRLDLLFNGIMPRFGIPGYKWYSTGHIHQLSIRDFENFCNDNNLKILGIAHIGSGRFLSLPTKLLIKFLPNLFASLGIFLTEEKI